MNLFGGRYSPRQERPEWHFKLLSCFHIIFFIKDSQSRLTCIQRRWSKHSLFMALHSGRRARSNNDIVRTDNEDTFARDDTAWKCPIISGNECQPIKMKCLGYLQT